MEINPDDAKKIVNEAHTSPQMILSGVSQDTAETTAQFLENVGAKVNYYKLPENTINGDYGKIICEEKCDIVPCSVTPEIKFEKLTRNQTIVVTEKGLIFVNVKNDNSSIFIGINNILDHDEKIHTVKPFLKNTIIKGSTILFYVQKGENKLRLVCTFDYEHYDNYCKVINAFHKIIESQKEILRIKGHDNKLDAEYGIRLYDNVIKITNFNTHDIRTYKTFIFMKSITNVIPVSKGSQEKVLIVWNNFEGKTKTCSIVLDETNDTTSIIEFKKQLIKTVNKTVVEDVYYYGGNPGLDTFSGEAYVKLNDEGLTIISNKNNSSIPISYQDIKQVRFETKKEIEQRLTATRVALLGAYAFLFKKKEEVDKKYLTIELKDASAINKGAALVFSGINSELLYVVICTCYDIYKPLEKEPQLEKSDKKDYIQELKELKELVDIGVITEEEFILKKKQILNIE